MISNDQKNQRKKKKHSYEYFQIYSYIDLKIFVPCHLLIINNKEDRIGRKEGE